MQVAQSWQDLQGVRDRLRQRQACVVASRGPDTLEDVLHRLPAHIFHDDVADGRSGASVGVLDEVVDVHDIGVLDLCQEPPLGDRRRHGVCVAGVE